MWRKFNSMSMLKTHAPAIFSVNDTFSTVHTNKIRIRLRFDPLSRAFSNRCVFDQNPQRIGACAQNAWTHRNICLFDGALHYISSVLGQTEKNSKLWVDKSPVRTKCKTKAAADRNFNNLVDSSGHWLPPHKICLTSFFFFFHSWQLGQTKRINKARNKNNWHNFPPLKKCFESVR